jgi:hypothetical protein
MQQIVDWPIRLEALDDGWPTLQESPAPSVENTAPTE